MRLVRCRRCALVYSDPQPRTLVAERYLREYDIAAHFAAVGVRKRVLVQRWLHYLPPVTEGRRRLCDVGCAGGDFLAAAREAGWDCFGVELNPPAAARARGEGFQIAEGDFVHLDDLPWGTFDVVTSWDCLEHSPQPQGFAERLVRLCKPGASIFVSTLNIDSLAFGLLGARWSMVQEDHFTYWNAQSLQGLFRRLGCDIHECHTLGLGRDLVRWLDNMQNRRRSRGAAGARLGVDRRSGGSRGGWDVHPFVLAAERLVNGLLSATGSGVEIVCVSRAA